MSYKRLTDKNWKRRAYQFNDIYKRLAELEDRIESGQLMEPPEKVWIVERTPFCGNEITEYEVSSCIYVKGNLQEIVVNNECSKNYHIDIVEYHKYVRDSYLCFSYEEAVEKLIELRGEE